jgi:ATP-dependent helicase Lhr and Lhr-like helicase
MTAAEWFVEQGYIPAPFQRETWQRYAAGNNGLLIAPTGAGKTYALMGAVADDALAHASQPGGLRLLWITPLRALAGDIATALQAMSDGVGLGWQVELRLGDTSSSVKARQRKRLPEILVTTPESLHIMLSYPGGNALFGGLQCVVADEWHDLLPTKRGVMMQLALAHLADLAPAMRVWGISATLGNTDEATDVLLAAQNRPRCIVRDARPKQIDIHTLIPEDLERFPWAGHVGDRLLQQVLAVIHANRSSLVFTNTRKQSELWYHRLLAADRDLAGQIALHHGSLASGERAWVESALHEGRLKAVICTSSLDLGVDFRPVDAVLQIGNPKGVARFLQRGGRSGHAPGETSRLYFVPTHALELFDAAALKSAVAEGQVESLHAPANSLDVLVQWLVTLGVGDGFESDAVYQEIIKTAAFRTLRPDQWQWALTFVTTGGAALGNYDQYRKLTQGNDGLLQSGGTDISRRHRQAIGAITSSSGLKVQVLRGQVVGSVDESFAGALQAGQLFWLGGRPLEFVRLRDMTVWVHPAKGQRGITPTWTGGRLPLTDQLAAILRQTVARAAHGDVAYAPELQALQPLIAIQQAWSHIPAGDELLIEQFKDRAGHHIIVYPFEGRATHEIMATLWAGRLGRDPNTFSFAYNDYGFELLAAVPVTLDEQLVHQLFSLEGLEEDVRQAILAGSLPQRQFRSIATIAGLVFRGRPGKPQSTRHLQASSETIYEVLRQYDPDNQLLQQAYDEVIDGVIDIHRLRAALERLAKNRIVIKYPPHPTPFAFPLIAERMRERLSTETLGERLARMQQSLERFADAR